MTKCVVLIVEGDTELEFYKRFVQYAKKRSSSSTEVEYINVKGFGQFKVTALRKFVNDIKPKHKESSFVIALCRDTDVFEYDRKPTIDWKKIEKAFLEEGVQRVIHVEAKHCIEDWFLIDLENIIKYLRLSKNTKIQGRNGVEKLSKLFKAANKVYYKGYKAKELISYLDLEKIISEISKELEVLYNEIANDF